MEREVGERLSGKLSPVFIDLVKYYVSHQKFNHFVFSVFQISGVTGSGDAEVIIVLVKFKPSSADNPHLP